MRTIRGLKRSDRTDYWKGQLENFKASGLSQKQFCQRESLPLSTFCYWKRKIQKESTSAVEFYPLTLSSAATMPETTGLLLMVCKKRFAIEIQEDFSQKALTRLVSVLEQL